jgi:hypothetical protein
LTELVPVNYGEFFLYDKWFWLLNQVALILPKTNIVIPTNGSKVDDEVVDKLCKIPNISVINFSLNALLDSTYTNFMGFDPKVLNTIKAAMMRLRARRPDITLWASMVFDPRYQTDLERDMFVKYWKPLAEPQIIHAASAGRDDNQPLHPVTLPCRSLFSDFVIGYDGKLSSCCFDAAFSMDLGYYSGNVLKDWKNPKLEELRRLHNEGRRSEVDLCKVCTFA